MKLGHERSGSDKISWRRTASALIVVGILWGCAALNPRTMLPPSTTVTEPPSALPPSVMPPAIEPDASAAGVPQDCYYVWATRELPELSAEFQSRMREVDSSAAASAYAFGEECRTESGEGAFIAMETDFRVRLQVESIEDEQAMGLAMRDTMLVIGGLRVSDLSGPRPGRVEFEYSAPDMQFVRVIVEIARYQQEAGGLEGTALFRHFLASP